MTIDYRAPSVSDQAELLARTLPDGRVWNSKWFQSRVLGRLVLALAAEINRLFARISNFVLIELDPLKTRQLILEWEESVGIPDDCFDRSPSLIERRRRVNQKLTNFGELITAPQIVALLADFGENIALVPGSESIGFDLGFGNAPYTTQELKEIRHTLVVRVESDAPTFTLSFPIQFGTEQSNLIQCLLERVIPANVALQFFFNQNLALPFGTPDTSNSGGASMALQAASMTSAGTAGTAANAGATLPGQDADVSSAGTSAPAVTPDVAVLSALADAGASTGTGGSKALVAGSNRMMVYTQHLRSTAANNADTAVVSYGGRTMTPRLTSPVIGAGGNLVRTRIYTLGEADLALAVGDVFTDDISDTTIRATAALYGNVDQTNPIVDDAVITAGSGGALALPALTTEDGGRVVAGATANSFGQSTSADWAGAAEAVDVDQDVAWYGAADDPTTGANENLTVTFTGATSNGCAAAISLRKA